MERIKSLFDGRIGRKTYLFRSMLAFAICLCMEMLALSIGGVKLGDLLFWPIILLSSIYSVSLTVRRLHDIGRRGVLALMFFCPLVNVVMGWILILKKGDVGENIYGADPLVRK